MNMFNIWVMTYMNHVTQTATKVSSPILLTFHCVLFLYTDWKINTTNSHLLIFTSQRWHHGSFVIAGVVLNLSQVQGKMWIIFGVFDLSPVFPSIRRFNTDLLSTVDWSDSLKWHDFTLISISKWHVMSTVLCSTLLLIRCLAEGLT